MKPFDSKVAHTRKLFKSIRTNLVPKIIDYSRKGYITRTTMNLIPKIIAYSRKGYITVEDDDPLVQQILQP